MRQFGLRRHTLGTLWTPFMIAAAGILAHAVLLLTDYIVWDGWWCVADIREPRGLPIMGQIFRDVGRPLDVWFYAPFKLLGGDPIVWAKALCCCAWIVTSVCMYVVLRRGAHLPRQLSATIGLLSVTMPSFDLLGELSLWMYTACVLLFWLAWAVVCLTSGTRGWLFILLRLIAISLFFFSFNLNSQLVFFFGIAAMLFGLRLRELRWKLIPVQAARVAIRHADYISLPVIFWIWKTQFTPASGPYAESYNRPSFSLGNLAVGYAGMAWHFLAGGIRELFASSNCTVLAVVVVIAAAVTLSRRKSRPEPVIGRIYEALIGWGFFLLMAAAFPYLSVGQQLSSEGWLNRNAILCNLPLSLMWVGILATLNLRMLPTRPWLWMAAVCGLTVLGIGNCNRNYLALQAFGVKERSIQRKLMRAIDDHSASVVQLRDYYDLPGTIPYYPPSIWTFIAAGGASTPKAFVLETCAIAPDQIVVNAYGQPEVSMPKWIPTSQDIERAIVATTMPYAMQKIPRSGPQILVAILPGDLGSRSVQLGLQYLSLKILDNSRCRDFEDRITVGQVFSLPDVVK